MALSNVRTCNIGPLTVVHGTYVHVAAAASETLDVSGEVVALIVNAQTAVNTSVDANPNAYSQSLSGQVRTITFLQNAVASAGTFLVITRNGI